MELWFSSEIFLRTLLSNDDDNRWVLDKENTSRKGACFLHGVHWFQNPLGALSSAPPRKKGRKLCFLLTGHNSKTEEAPSISKRDRLSSSSSGGGRHSYKLWGFIREGKGRMRTMRRRRKRKESKQQGRRGGLGLSQNGLFSPNR